MRQLRWIVPSAAFLLAALADAASPPRSRATTSSRGRVRLAEGEDFIAVIDADPQSPRYGQLITSAASGIVTQQIHHTEYWMPDNAQLFANDHMSGETVVFDLSNPLKPRVHAKYLGQLCIEIQELANAVIAKSPNKTMEPAR
jgi:hypothetical protein